MNSKEKFKWIKENISIVDYAAKIGYTPIKKGKYYSLKEHDSIMIDTSKNVYWQNSIPGCANCIGEQGTVIDFAIKFNNMSLYEVIKEFESDFPREYISTSKKHAITVKNEKLMLPEKDTNMQKIFAYLIKTRCIAQKVVQDMVDRKMLYQDIHGNCVFVGYDIDEKNKPIFGCLRGTNTYKKFIGDVSGCDYDKCFYINNSKEILIITESVIDAMSIMTLMGAKYKNYNYLALGGVGKWEAVKTYLDTGEIKKVIIATDNDDGGIAAAQQMCLYFREMHPYIVRQWKLPDKTYGKDWNKVLQVLRG